MHIENPYHEGEIQVQERAGVRTQALQSGGVISDTIIKGALPFIAQQNILLLGSVDSNNNIWASILVGVTGFVQATNDSLITVDLSKSMINENDPLWENIKSKSEIGLLFIELSSRRRLRVNTRIVSRNSKILNLEVKEAYPNCPRYIQKRFLNLTLIKLKSYAYEFESGYELNQPQIDIIQCADTMFIATAHSERGVDVSHRGGKSGFVRIVDKQTLLLPDFQGNSMFNTFGNLSLNPRVGLLFNDFENGTTLQVTGRAEILWDYEDSDLDAERLTGGTNRFCKIKIDSYLLNRKGHQLYWEFQDYSPYIPE